MTEDEHPLSGLIRSQGRTIARLERRLAQVTEERDNARKKVAAAMVNVAVVRSQLTSFLCPVRPEFPAWFAKDKKD